MTEQFRAFFQRKIFPAFFLAILIVAAFTARTSAAPEFFTFAELETLYEQENLSEPLQKKLDLLLTTPFVDNSFGADANFDFARTPQLGRFLRVAHWNIERGLEYEAIEALFIDPAKFEALLDPEKFPKGSDERAEILKEAVVLRAADVIVFNEVDLGMKRTDYRDVAAELARKLKMNYAFGTQFVELSPVHLSQEKADDKDAAAPDLSEKEAAEEKELAAAVKVDPERYKGLHGIAILSRLPLSNVRLVPFKNQPYDWYKSEKNGTAWLEKGKRLLGKQIFLEKILREVRRGGRTTLLADVTDERFPAGRVTIAATHLENRTKSKNRVRQLDELLETIRPIDNPVIVAGDMNTSSSDLTPTSLRRELTKRFGNPSYWVKKAIQYTLGFGLVEDIVLGGLSFGRTYADPTVKHVPFFSPNPGEKFFSHLKKFRFADGGAFDFRGEENRSYGGREKTLANSNERARKGFVTTYQVKRTIYIIGKYKLDWIFVKPAALKKPYDTAKGSYRFAPHFGQTLGNLNRVLPDRISDHHPLIVDLPLEEPLIGVEN